MNFVPNDKLIVPTCQEIWWIDNNNKICGCDAKTDKILSVNMGQYDINIVDLVYFSEYRILVLSLEGDLYSFMLDFPRNLTKVLTGLNICKIYSYSGYNYCFTSDHQVFCITQNKIYCSQQMANLYKNQFAIFYPECIDTISICNMESFYGLNLINYEISSCGHSLNIVDKDSTDMFVIDYDFRVTKYENDEYHCHRLGHKFTLTEIDKKILQSNNYIAVLDSVNDKIFFEKCWLKCANLSCLSDLHKDVQIFCTYNSNYTYTLLFKNHRQNMCFSMLGCGGYRQREILPWDSVKDRPIIKKCKSARK